MPSDNEFFTKFSESVPGSEQIITQTIEELDARFKERDYIKANFSTLVRRIEDDAHRMYRKYEREAGAEALKNHFTRGGAHIPRPEALGSLFQQSFEDLNAFFLSLSQSRKTRAGKAFELIIRILFRKLSYPFDEQIVINGKPDFLLPGKIHYERHASDCIIFTAKRTLRERWRQIVTEGTRGLGFYLATIDEKVTEHALSEMSENRIYIVTPAELKSSIAHYGTAPNVISFESFFRQHLDPAMQRWQENGVI